MHYCYCRDATKEVEIERDYKLHFKLKQLPVFLGTRVVKLKVIGAKGIQNQILCEGFLPRMF